MLKLFKPYVTWKAIWNAVCVLRSDQLAEGLEVKKLEHEISTRFNLPHVACLNSGSSALELAYELAGIGPGDEVIVPVLTCTATNIPLVRRGAKIVFADISHDLNINIDDVKRKITPWTKAIVFVHFGGNNRGLRDLLEICKAQSIILIEDAAQALASSFWGKGDFTCVSLQAIKTITAGDGGFLACRKKEDHEKAKRLRWFGYDREEKQKVGDTDLTEAGYKYHMNNISAAIARGNLASFDTILAHQRMLADIYRSYGLFAYSWLAGGFTDAPVTLKQIYQNYGIEIGQHHYRNDKYTLFGERRADLPGMDELESKYFFVPYHMGVSAAQAHEIGRIYKSNL